VPHGGDEFKDARKSWPDVGRLQKFSAGELHAQDFFLVALRFRRHEQRISVVVLSP
jgi:hypothetical protein